MGEDREKLISLFALLFESVFVRILCIVFVVFIGYVPPKSHCDGGSVMYINNKGSLD